MLKESYKRNSICTKCAYIAHMHHAKGTMPYCLGANLYWTTLRWVLTNKKKNARNFVCLGFTFGLKSMARLSSTDGVVQIPDKIHCDRPKKTHHTCISLSQPDNLRTPPILPQLCHYNPPTNCYSSNAYFKLNCI